MKTDRTTKFLLLLIALGLWFNAAVSLLRPMAVKADTDSALANIEKDVHTLSTDLHSTIYGVMQVGVRGN